MNTNGQATTTQDATRFVDIWSRPGLWARQRAYMFLAVNLCVYGSLCVFMFWLQNGDLFDFSWGSYTGTYHRTLIDLLIFPISISEAPIMIVIIGMLMANLIIVPILISQLFGFRFSALFVACVGVLGHLPVLALFLLVSSFICAVTRHRLRFKFGITILALLPLLIYFYVATRGAQLLQLRSYDATLLYAPWVLAFLAASGIAAAVLGFVKLLKYRPGAILSAMVPFFAIPGILFGHYVGADQLEFRILSRRYTPDRHVGISSADIMAQLLDRTLRHWRWFKVPSLDAALGMARRQFVPLAHGLLHDERQAVITACEAFEEKYPKSRFVPNALYLRGLAEDMRFDYGALAASELVYHYEHVSSQSRRVWLRLTRDFPDHACSQAGRYRLAVMAVRGGQIEQAKALLKNLLGRMPALLEAQTSQPTAPRTFREIFTRPQPLAIPWAKLQDIEQKSRSFLELIEHNSDDPKFGNAPLMALTKLDRRHPKWRSHLLDLAMKYVGGKLTDNLMVQYASTDPDPIQRKAALERYAKEFADQDGGALALYELAKLMRVLALYNLDKSAGRESRRLYSEVMKRYPQYSVSELARGEVVSVLEFKTHE